MTALRMFLSRLLGLVGGAARGDRELRAEIDAHTAEATHESVRAGMTPLEARRAALARFGGMTQTNRSPSRAAPVPAVRRLRAGSRVRRAKMSGTVTGTSDQPRK